MLRKTDLEQLAHSRKDEATTLLAASHFAGAYYIGGYAIELALKSRIAGLFQSGVIPDRKFVDKVYTHDLKQLVALAELEIDHREKIGTDAVFAQHWEYVTGWSETARYVLTGEDKARPLVEGLQDLEHGVFGWIMTHW
ncbi:MAG: hypothetical protein JO289_17865, partial [Xanthobacteraceae bacterium]|nr:hypothetical protein [Xanthobacteraceae bacterium]